MKYDDLSISSNVKKTTMTKNKMLPNTQKPNSLWKWWFVLICFKILGLATFTIYTDVNNNSRNKKETIQFVYSRLGSAYNLILICVVVAVKYVCVSTSFETAFANDSPFSVGFGSTENAITSICVCGIFIMYCWDQKTMLRITCRVIEMKNQFRKVKSLIHRQTFLMKSIFFVILNFISNIILLILEIFSLSDHNTLLYLINTVLGFLVSMLFIQYYLAIAYFNARLVEVNNAIQDLLRKNWTEHQYDNLLTPARSICVSDSSVSNLLQLKYIHTMLCEICNEIAEFYAAPILFGTTLTFYSLIYNAYYLVMPIVTNSYPLTKIDAIDLATWIICLLYPLALATINNTLILKEFKKTGTIVHKLLDNAVGTTIKTELKQFSQQLLHQNVEFTAYGIFPFDSSLLHMILAAVTSYLIILIQFQIGQNQQRKHLCNCTAT
ncbi:putative gustatory receptor 28b [Prorops nasuta]|uniref:putative gustatory receptor 28b n=1 Tax=Prorops nasuta TaxID=863751 RepID=UPI0034CDCEC9